MATEQNRGLTINEALEMVPDHGINADVLAVIGGEDAQNFVNMDSGPRAQFLIRNLSPRDNEAGRVVKIAEIPGIHTTLLAKLGEAGIVESRQPTINVSGEFGMSAGAHVTTAPYGVATGATRPLNRYREVLNGNLSPRQAQASGIRFHMDVDTIERLGRMLAAQVFLAANLDGQVVARREEGARTMRTLKVPQGIKDTFYTWSEDVRFDPHSRRNKWIREHELMRVLAGLSGLFGNNWKEFMVLVGDYADMISARDFFGSGAQIDLSQFRGLGRLKNDLPLMAGTMVRKAEDGTLLSAGLPVIQMFEPVDTTFAANIGDLFPDVIGATNKRQSFMSEVYGVDPTVYMLAEASRGLVYGLGMVNPRLGSDLDPELLTAYGEAAMLWRSLYDAVTGAYNLPVQEAPFRSSQSMATPPAASVSRTEVNIGFRGWFNINFTCTNWRTVNS